MDSLWLVYYCTFIKNGDLLGLTDNEHARFSIIPWVVPWKDNRKTSVIQVLFLWGAWCGDVEQDYISKYCRVLDGIV